MSNNIKDKHILVVDDIAINLRLMQAMLNASGFLHVHLESDSLKVKEWIETIDIGLIILDLSMPEKDGLTVFRELKEMSQTIHLPPVIFVTALNDNHWKEEAMTLGAAGFVTKPFDQVAFIQLISELL